MLGYLMARIALVRFSYMVSLSLSLPMIDALR